MISVAIARCEAFQNAPTVAILYRLEPGNPFHRMIWIPLKERWISPHHSLIVSLRKLILVQIEVTNSHIGSTVIECAAFYEHKVLLCIHFSSQREQFNVLLRTKSYSDCWSEGANPSAQQ